MTDVFLSYAREDRERVRRLADALQAGGFDVWLDPSEPRFDRIDEDARLQAAACVLVVWSAAARRLDYVRSEAATGLYRDRMIQARIDATDPPRPFDHLGVADLSHWRGDRDHPEWRRLVTAVRSCVGVRPEPALVPKSTSKPARRPEPAPLPVKAKPRAPKPERTGASPAHVAGALVLLAAAGAGLWFMDPMGWRAGASQPEAHAAAPAPHPVVSEADEAAARDWARIDRDDARALRAYLVAHPKSVSAESAQSLLRVLDAQAWSDAEAAGTQNAYASYLESFPADAAFPGMKAGEAQARLAAVDTDREEALRKVQRGLSVLGLYAGEIDGKAGRGTQAAAATFAQKQQLGAVDLATEDAADLYAFADLVEVEVRRADQALTAEARAQE